MNQFKNLLKISKIYCFIGPFIGVFLFWLGAGFIVGSQTETGLMQGLTMGLGGAPLVIFFGFPVGIIISLLNAIALWLIIKGTYFSRKPVASGAASGVFPLLFLFIISLIIDTIIFNKSIEYVTLFAVLWLIVSSGITGAILGPVAIKRLSSANIKK